ncbi:hypothetical protein H5410_002207 [Solanum commersonii]|uniref:Aminotransferase-like plant mobile domain-containing protein n=1 Tax=Solanum commersonii TaxID=4109 RepID=A0A9J6B1N6_SOLCO|nr:hypothetical protein H5410_002207 [Solanum commersonii]
MTIAKMFSGIFSIIRELSIYLWDLRTDGGLPVHGFLYDEVIPSAKELTYIDDQGKSFFPRSCSFLFLAFYRLTKGAIDKVSFQEWTKFWFRGPRKYVEPSSTTSKNLTKPRMNHDPSRNINMSFLPRTEEENAPFAKLGVEESFKDETYLATFLACWFCKFVLSNKKVDCIRASVFKVSSLMAHEEIFSLAVPSDFLIGLCSSFVTFRLDDELIVEPYSPHRFGRQFGYCQDVPSALIEHHYDGFIARFDETMGFMCSSWKLFEDHHTNVSIQ